MEGMDRQLLIDLLYKMLLIRRFEEKTAEMYVMGKIGGYCHLYIGEEAVAVGAISALREDDFVITHYRDHGHCLARGSEPGRVLAELFGRVTGVSRGKGGSMHLFDKERNLLGGFAIVAGHLPLATGVGFAIKYQGGEQVVLCIFGDGAVNQGVFHESLNLATVWKLPVIYLCENNRYAMGTPLDRTTSLYNIAEKACAYDMARFHIDGMDVLTVREAVAKAVERARKESLPTFIEVRTYRFRGHSMADPAFGHYRTKEELEEQKKRDPIILYKQRLISEGIINEADYNNMDKEIKGVVEEAVKFADKSPEPPLNELYTDVYVEG